VSISRRQLLGYVPLVALPGAAIGQTTTARRFDIECDVLVAGSGIAGMCAALECLDQGLSVHLVESQPTAGGSTAMSGGVLYLGGGTRLQRALGFEDSADNMFAFLSQAGAAPTSLERLRIYCDGAAEHFDWFVAQGVEFSERFSELKERPQDTASLYYSGNENAASYAGIADPAPRGHVAAVPGRTGHYLIATLTTRAVERGLAMSLETAIDELITVDDEVRGAWVVREGARLAVHARKGVVIACGGFTQNAQMLRRHAPRLAECTPLSGPGDIGTGIRIASAIGAETLRMEDGFAIIPLYPSYAPLKGLIVNRQGQRFVAEDAYIGVTGHHIAMHEEGSAYLIVDAQTDSEDLQRFPRLMRVESLADIASAMGMNPSVLQATITIYNEAAERGEDLDYNKSAQYLVPLDAPPWSVYNLSVGSGFFPAHTFGGLHTDSDGRVMHVNGRPIPGLYAAGRSARGIPSGPYLASGLSLGDGSFFGRRAGRHIVRERS
jgi:3-oxo-5alpha-steroid 4-dehydrogenase